jgi:hypothetical protein
MVLSAFPLLLIAVAAYNALAFTAPARIAAPVLAMTLPSGARLVLSGGDAIVILGLGLLFVEVFKATRTGNASILDHSLSMLLALVVIVELLLVPEVGQNSFLLLLLLCLLDVVAGFTVTISSARRDVGLGGGLGGGLS